MPEHDSVPEPPWSPLRSKLIDEVSHTYRHDRTLRLLAVRVAQSVDEGNVALVHELFQHLDEYRQNAASAEAERFFQALKAHLPGLVPALDVLYAHIFEGLRAPCVTYDPHLNARTLTAPDPDDDDGEAA